MGATPTKCREILELRGSSIAGALAKPLQADILSKEMMPLRSSRCGQSRPSGCAQVRGKAICMFLMLLNGRVGGQQILNLSQPPNSKSNDVNHTEPEFFLQAVNEMKVGARETNGRRLEFLVLHELKFCNWTIGLSLLKINWRVLGDI
jgi:hypothetical protein